MITDHFDMESSTILDFWIRGTSVFGGGLVYALQKVPTDAAVKIATAVSVACGVLYPWNAKFGYLSKGLPVKYPMHYVPEVLMLGLSLAGMAAM